MGVYVLAAIPTKFQGKMDRTLEWSTPAWLIVIIVVTRGNSEEQEQKLIDVLSELEKTEHRRSEKKSDFFRLKL